MDQQSIFIPFFGLMALTILVWMYMYYQRLGYVKRQNIDPQSLATSEDMVGLIPARINTPSENLINLFELPVLFYATCIYLYVTQRVDMTNLILAYGFLVLRIGHSVIHCTYNRVMHRFYIYILSTLVLWTFIILAFIGALNNQ